MSKKEKFLTYRLRVDAQIRNADGERSREREQCHADYIDHQADARKAAIHSFESKILKIQSSFEFRNWFDISLKIEDDLKRFDFFICLII